MNCSAGMQQSRKVKTYCYTYRVAVVLVRAGETEDRAWQRHIREYPEDRNADVRIFHFGGQK